jgi:hypothetical protein
VLALEAPCRLCHLLAAAHKSQLDNLQEEGRSDG